jgi:hypothetical protein
VSIKRKLRMLCLCLPLLAGALSGVPMLPEDMERLLEAARQAQIEHVIPDEGESEDETIRQIKKLIEAGRR